MVRIRSEHAIGFLKGRFQSLKGLCINVWDERTHKFARYWIAACIGLHAFAMHCEAEKRGDDDLEADEDFIAEGLEDDGSDDSDQDVGQIQVHHFGEARSRLSAGKLLCEWLKAALFRAKTRYDIET